MRIVILAVVFVVCAVVGYVGGSFLFSSRSTTSRVTSHEESSSDENEQTDGEKEHGEPKAPKEKGHGGH